MDASFPWDWSPCHWRRSLESAPSSHFRHDLVEAVCVRHAAHQKAGKHILRVQDYQQVVVLRRPDWKLFCLKTAARSQPDALA